jgi:general nucleoside transport system permease protein
VIQAMPSRMLFLRRAASGAAAFGLTVLAGAAILHVLGAPPLAAYKLIVLGAVGRPEHLTFVLAAWAPLLLAAAGLLVTFAAGLWNIGIEGQIVLGAIYATGALRGLGHALPPWLALLLAGAAALLGGAVWALVAGALRVYGGVNEIFGGLGLNFIAGSLTVYLVVGPWGRPGIASTSGTVPFEPALWLPAPAVARVALPAELVVALAALAAVAGALRGTYFGLDLAAMGRSLRAARLRGIATVREMLWAFAVCGGVAGLAGFALVAGALSRHQLFPLISGGTGYLAILVVLLAGQSPVGCVLLSAAFAAISMGSLQLPLAMELDSSMGGVIEGLLVLFMLLLRGLRMRAPARTA